MEKNLIFLGVLLLALGIRIVLNFRRIRKLYKAHEEKLKKVESSWCEHDWCTKMQYDPFTGHGIAWSRCAKCGRQKHTWRI